MPFPAHDKAACVPEVDVAMYIRDFALAFSLNPTLPQENKTITNNKQANKPKTSLLR